jgi:glycine/D-amino acid oxidase-like deaminating enzyme
MSYDFCVIGNGPVGAAITLELSRWTPNVCVIGAGYGEQGRYSSHEDDSRLTRGYHDDPYWEALAVQNREHLTELERETGLEIVKDCPVYYRPTPARASACLLPAEFRSARGDRCYTARDACGGFFDPRLYVQALNARSRRAGATIRRGVVSKHRRVSGRHRVESSAGAIDCDRLIDARGLYDLAPSDEVWRVGKVVVFVESSASGPGTHAFIDAAPGSDEFSDVYAIIDYPSGSGGRVSKFGFTERDPVTLDSERSVTAWYEGGFRDYPFSGAIADYLAAYGGTKPARTWAKPCAFTRTRDGRPRMSDVDGVLKVRGCNGSAAKCCQALAKTFLLEAGVAS